MSKREELRKRRQAQARQRQLAVLAVIVIIALSVTGFVIYQNSQPIGEIKPIARQTWPLADGKALGAKEAKVVFLEFGDFQ